MIRRGTTNVDARAGRDMHGGNSENGKQAKLFKRCRCIDRDHRSTKFVFPGCNNGYGFAGK
jgi:hypothetical protein